MRSAVDVKCGSDRDKRANGMDTRKRKPHKAEKEIKRHSWAMAPLGLVKSVSAGMHDEVDGQ